MISDRLAAEGFTLLVFEPKVNAAGFLTQAHMRGVSHRIVDLSGPACAAGLLGHREAKALVLPSDDHVVFWVPDFHRAIETPDIECERRHYGSASGAAETLATSQKAPGTLM